MNQSHTPHSSPDPAADAIRAALPDPDVATTERIAARIADGAIRDARVSAPGRTARRRVGILRPALIAGVAALATGVALLAPGADPSGTNPNRMALGPDVAAAEALQVAGTTVADGGDGWHPLRAGEFHYTRSSDELVFGRQRVITEQWIDLDGTGRTRISREPLFRAAGTRYFVPAQTCQSFERVKPGAVPDMDPTPTTLPAGSAIPACWSSPYAPIGLGHPVGSIIEAPPAGAPVEVDALFVAFGDTELEYGGLVREARTAAEARSTIPPGATLAGAAPLGPAGVTKPAGEPLTDEQVETDERGETPKVQPLLFDPATTWIEVESAPTISADVARKPGDTPAMMLPGSDFHWDRAIPLADVANLPEDAKELGALLRRQAMDMNAAEVAKAKAGKAAAVFNSDREATVALAVQLLTEAPMSPAARRATFTLLSDLAEASGATVDRDVRLADGTPTLAIAFPIAQPAQYDDGTDHRYLLYFDERTANLLGTRFDYGTTDTSISRWTPPARVTSTEQTPRD
ncbi:MAG: hypothetical protein JWM86_19 [Thermoleophilia bacterium]|nr:hypothetical protein [Thermoleophilia bacterium]